MQPTDHEVLPMTDSPSTPAPTRHRRAWLAAGAAALGASGALYLGAFGSGGPTGSVRLAGVTEDLSGPCDEAEHADDPRCAGSSTVPVGGGAPSSTAPTSTSTAVTPTTAAGPGAGPAGGEVRTVQAGDAGTVLYAVEGSQLRLVLARPNGGWRVEVEQAGGREIEVDFEAGSVEVDVDLELEDGRVRERVRIEDDADDSEIRLEDGRVVRHELGDDDDHDDDRRGHDDDDHDDDDRSGRGGDDD